MSVTRDKVIVALDYEDPEKAYRLVDTLEESISWYKVGPVLFTQSGVEVIRFLHSRSKRIFVDLKLHDTPNVVAATVKQFADMGVDFATVHCIGGRKMLHAASTGCRGSKLKLLGVTVLTSHGVDYAREVGWEENAPSTVMRLLTLALESRLTGIICSPHEIAEVKPHILPGFQLITPGIRLPKEEVFQDDQERIASPEEALSWGADYVVIGRPITQAREPREVVKRLFRKVE